jgi:hypothetical protein
LSDATWTLLKGLLPLLLVIGVLVSLRSLQRKVGKPRPAALHCATCETPNPGIRIPNSLNQALWGGWTCAGCGATVNAQGEPIPDAPPRAPSRPLNGPIAALYRRRPGLVMGLVWGLSMWLAMSLAPEVLATLHGGVFGTGKVLVGLLVWGGAGGLFFGSAMRLALFRKPKA